VSREDKMTEEDRTLMERYGITSATKMLYFYKEYRYESAADALHYAKGETKRAQNNGLRTPIESAVHSCRPKVFSER
jgi:hypothetical protein